LPPGGFTVIGGGKTAMDACLWLLDSGGPPELIRWIRPRDAWLLDRAFQRPLDLVGWLIEGQALSVEAAAEAEDAGDLCSATGLRMVPGRPVFASGLITLQATRSCQPTFSAALAGYLEATRDDDAAKNRLCPPNPYPDTAFDWIATTCVGLRAQERWLRDPALAAWLDRSRLNAARGIRDHLTEPAMKSAVHRLLANNEKAVSNLTMFQAQARQATANPARRRIPTT
jgi:hypothetical protein